MSWSRAEVQALATRAARGAGAPAAQAVHFGRAAALHLARGRPASEVSQALAALPEGPVLRLPLALQRLRRAGGGDEIDTGGLPDLARSYVETLGMPLTIREVSPDALIVSPTKTAPLPDPGRITGCEALIAEMTELAAHTLVPESDVSRQAGAGAGVTDTD
ncbi:hypothetical protein [uncultured Roseobacter sp.]|uniref:hypothetical protein n=1 Tax=uncultured Roseobacter sp. TaxID=114847 RepID=UPI00261C8689|nr:hypothetical protein [uncultured Roseobacter sp.]